MSYLAQVTYTGNGSTTGYALPFSYIASSHVKAFINNVSNTAFTISGSTLTFTSAPANSAVIRLERQTPTDARLVDFTDGSVLTEADLDQSADQNFFIAQETSDSNQSAMTIGTDDKFDAQSKVIKNVANPTNNNDAVNKTYLENTWLSTANKTALTTVNANISNINAVNSNASNINAVAGDASDIGTVASNIGSVTTVASDISKVIAVANDLAEAVSEIETVADDLNEASSEIDVVAGAIANVNTVGGISANVTSVANIAANVTSVAGVASNVTAVAGISGDVTAVANIASDVAQVENIKANVTTVAGISANVTSVAGISSAVSAVNSNSSNINAVNSNASNINTVAGNNSNISTVAGVSSDVTSVAGIASDVSAVENIASNVTTVAGISSAVSTVAADGSDIGTVAGISSAVSTVSSNNANVSAVAGAVSNVNTTASNITSVNTTATNIANVNTVAGVSSALAGAAGNATAAANSASAAANSAAAAATALDSFDDRYLGAKSSEPSVDNDGNALVSGSLFFDSSVGSMKVFDGGNWILATSAGAVSLLNYEYTATAGQTTFSGSDNNSATLSYSAGNLIVTLNGIVLDNGSDYTATSGTSIVLASGAALNDHLAVVAFKSFTAADTVPASTGGTFAGNVAVTGNISVTGTVDGRDVATDGTKLDGVAAGATAYVHPTGSGNNHVPAAGATGQLLQFASAGTAAWATVSSGVEVTFPSNWSSPTNTYNSSGTWSKGSLSDDDYVWIYLVGGGQGGGNGSVSGAGNRSNGGAGGSGIVIIRYKFQ